ncbi:MAG: hypothetical protein R3Y56_07815 [Akkermansia sp.]
MKALLPLFLATVALCPLAQAQFAHPALKYTLEYGQEWQNFTFTADSPIASAKPNCDCTTVRIDGNILVAQVNTKEFTEDTNRTISVKMKDGRRCTLWVCFGVPQALDFSTKTLLWERDAEATPQSIHISIPKGSPISKLKEAGLSGSDFTMAIKTNPKKRTYDITITPISTAKKCMNRLVIKTETKDERSSQYILYLRVR